MESYNYQSWYSTPHPDSGSTVNYGGYCQPQYDAQPMPQWLTVATTNQYPVAQYSNTVSPVSTVPPNNWMGNQPSSISSVPQQSYFQQVSCQPQSNLSPPESQSSVSTTSEYMSLPLSQESESRRKGRPRMFTEKERHQRKLESANKSRRKKNDSLKKLEDAVKVKETVLKRMNTMYGNLVDLEALLLRLS